MKIESNLIKEKGKEKLQDKYEEIYRDSDVWLYKRSNGIHSVIYNHIKGKINNKNVLDVGCGAGRLSIMMGFVANFVDAFDFSECAISIAKKNAECCGVRNVNFFIDEIEKFLPKDGKKYDLITLVGVIEHVKDPKAVLTKFGNLLKNHGNLIVSCPNFLNFRGDSYMTLLSLFGLPMSLADLRQIDYTNIKDWAETTGFELEKTVGAIYNSSWGEKAVKDMIKRVPLAVQDKQLKIELDYSYYNSWLESRIESNRMLLDFLEENGFLKRITKQVEMNFSNVDNIEKKLWSKMFEYINEDIEGDPYYSDVTPINYIGGECIYFLKLRG